MAMPDVEIELYRDQLRTFFLQLAPTTPLEELNEVVNEFSLDTFNKKQMILAAGDTSDTVYFVCKGLVRIYYIQEEKEITTWFIKENMVFASTYSILTGEKNFSFYESLEKSLVMKVQYAVMESYCRKYHSIEHLSRRMVESYYSTFMKRTHDVLFLSAEERYNLFIKDHSDILNRVPLRHVASYLGITQETLSRLRAKY